MGVPAFFRWLSKKYPSIVVTADRGMSHDYHFDNLYLDMNGIIHPCTHPEHKAAPETEEEMFEAIFEYIDMLIDMVRPTKLLYLAVDGVAPRAKMNQQRSRRFRAIKESDEKKQEISRVKDELRARGIEFDDEEEGKKAHFDSNVITPGTQFMINLSHALREWIDRKLDPDQDEPERRDTYGNVITPTVWPKDLVVILSDASVPGEGEHKIMEYIRKQKAQPNYDPNLSHCLCGADADLIMLGLATHELNFTILREEFVPNQPRPCDICAQYGHEMKECQGKANIPDPAFLIKNSGPGFIYIRLNVLREYFTQECEDLDLERYIDDFVFLCFFVGNDFLPHLPSLEIREGAIDRLLRIYKSIMSQYSHPKPYLTQNGFVSLDKIQAIFKELGKMEDDIFRNRRNSDVRYRERMKRQKQMDYQALGSAWMAPVQVVARGQAVQRLANVRQEAANLRSETGAKARLSAMMESSSSTLTDDSTLKGQKRKANEPEEANCANEVKSVEMEDQEKDEDEDDEVQLWNEGFKERYYLLKFDCTDHQTFSGKVAGEYARGLCWVLRYYYQGCVDWQWFYPFHYAPFASDFQNIGKMDIKFKRDARPFKPLEQLMSVFPAGSCQNLPATWQRLMKDSSSPIIDFYPSNFRIDLNGKKAAWQGVALLPFIDEQRLFRALEDVYEDLTAPETERNSLGPHLMFVSRTWDKPMSFLTKLLEQKTNQLISFPNQDLHGMFGSLRRSERYSDLYQKTFCFEFFDPSYDIEHIFAAKRLPKAIAPASVLKPDDFNHRNSDNRNQYRPTIGFNQRNDRATLGQYGHKVIEAQINVNMYHQSRTFGPSAYAQASSAAPPPIQRSYNYSPYAAGNFQNFNQYPSYNTASSSNSASSNTSNNSASSSYSSGYGSQFNSPRGGHSTYSSFRSGDNATGHCGSLYTPSMGHLSSTQQSTLRPNPNSYDRYHPASTFSTGSREFGSGARGGRGRGRGGGGGR